MPGPFIFIATNRLREGRFHAEQQRVPALSGFIEASEPRLIAFNEYVNEERSEVTVVQVHPDAASFEFHLGYHDDHVALPRVCCRRPRWLEHPAMVMGRAAALSCCRAERWAQSRR